jgi:hypothetical protein
MTIAASKNGCAMSFWYCKPIPAVAKPELSDDRI